MPHKGKDEAEWTHVLCLFSLPYLLCWRITDGLL
jgi:hypothetical protein